MHTQYTQPHLPTLADSVREALAPYVNLDALRQLVAEGGDVRAALAYGAVSDDLATVLAILAEVLTPAEHTQILNAADVAAWLMLRLGMLDAEEVWVIVLNQKSHIVKAVPLYRGTVNGAEIRPAEIFREALLLNAPRIILAHNHPTGDVTPSPEDISVTERIVNAGKLLDIAVLDHVIVGRGRYCSLREKGLGGF